MAPSLEGKQSVNSDVASNIPPPPPATRARYDKAGIPWQDGYPYYPPPPKFVQDVENIRKERERDFTDPGSKATDVDKEALFSAAKEVRNLSHNIGTEIVGLQLKDLNPSQLNALARLISERTVVFFRDQDLSPQKQKEIGLYLGDGLIEVHPQAPQVPTVEGVSIIWEPAFLGLAANKGRTQGRNFRSANKSGTGVWHTDLVHESFPPSYTHLHQDTVPPVGGDTFWSSGYSAYDKLSPTFRALIEPLKAVYTSAHKYLDANDPDAPPKNVERVHPLVRTHPVTGWKSLYVNRAMTSRIEGLEKSESDLILNYLFDVYESKANFQHIETLRQLSNLLDLQGTKTYRYGGIGLPERAQFGTIGSLSTASAGIMKARKTATGHVFLHSPKGRTSTLSQSRGVSHWGWGREI